MMKEIYLLSGLGADQRVFDYLDLKGYKLNLVRWIDPLEHEPIENYAKRLLKQIPSAKPTLLGVSFGGIMALEIGKLIETEKIVLISSVRTKFDLPYHYRIAGQLGLYRIIPAAFFKKVNRLTYWFFGVKNKQEKDLLKAIISETDEKFLKWSIDQILNWRNVTEGKNTTHIHGTWDRILPIRTPDFTIVDGGHFMIVNRAQEISALLRKILN